MSIAYHFLQGMQTLDRGDLFSLDLGMGAIVLASVMVIGMVMCLLRRTQSQKSDLIISNDAASSVQLIKALNLSQDGFSLLDKDGAFVWVSQGLCNLSGYMAEELLGQKPSLFKSGKQDSEYYQELWSTILSGQTYKNDIINRRKNGSLYNGLLTIVPLMDENDHISHFVTTITDTTEKEQSKIRLVNSERQFQTLMESMNDGFLVVDESDRLTFLNKSLADSLGYEINELLGVNFLSLLDEENAGIAKQQKEKRRFGHFERYELEVPAKDGNIVVFRVTPSDVIRTKSTFDGAFAIMTDITSQKRIDNQNAWLGKTLEGSLHEIYVFDATSLRFLVVNRGARENLGYSLTELQQLTPLDLKPDLQSDSFQSILAPLFGNEVETVSFLTNHKRKNDTLYPVEVHLQKANVGRRCVFVAMVQDCTERDKIQAELIHAKESAESMNRLKSAVLDNLSHEIRTPLSAILGFAQLLQGQVSSEHQEFVDYIKVGGERLMSTLESILELSQIDSGQLDLDPQLVDILSLVSTSVALLEPLATRKGLELKSSTDLKTTLCWTDESCLSRILDNLIGNAIKFTEKGSVSVDLREAESGDLFIEVTDTGIGMSKEFMVHMFEPFRQESTGVSRHYVGVGLGLSISKKLIHQLHGHLSVTSAEGEGSSFLITLPASIPSESNLTIPQAAGRDMENHLTDRTTRISNYATTGKNQ